MTLRIVLPDVDASKRLEVVGGYFTNEEGNTGGPKQIFVRFKKGLIEAGEIVWNGNDIEEVMFEGADLTQIANTPTQDGETLWQAVFRILTLAGGIQLGLPTENS